jgi:ABC-type polysaccharide/polyol phosphate export permease
VFVRDVAQMLPPLMTFWFFTTPILYSSSLLPEGLARAIEWNPMSWFIEFVRGAVLEGRVELMGAAAPAIVLATVALFWFSLRFFRRLSGHFEDFL